MKVWDCVYEVFSEDACDIWEISVERYYEGRWIPLVISGALGWSS